jgi:hypothetical protein
MAGDAVGAFRIHIYAGTLRLSAYGYACCQIDSPLRIHRDAGRKLQRESIAGSRYRSDIAIAGPRVSGQGVGRAKVANENRRLRSTDHSFAEFAQLRDRGGVASHRECSSFLAWAYAGRSKGRLDGATLAGSERKTTSTALYLFVITEPRTAQW